MKYLSIAAIFRSENSWLEEWIRYHLAAGVEHFYLYNDDVNTVVSDEILRPFVSKGIVDNIHVSNVKTIKHCSEKWKQLESYRHAIANVSSETEWLALVDLDEFILPRKCGDIKEVLEDYAEFDGLAVNWHVLPVHFTVSSFRKPTVCRSCCYGRKTNHMSRTLNLSIIFTVLTGKIRLCGTFRYAKRYGDLNEWGLHGI